MPDNEGSITPETAVVPGIQRKNNLEITTPIAWIHIHGTIQVEIDQNMYPLTDEEAVFVQRLIRRRVEACIRDLDKRSAESRRMIDAFFNKSESPLT